MRWYFPSWNGDFRLERIDDDATLLEVISPTAAELEILGELEIIARKKGWCGQDVSFWRKGWFSSSRQKTRLDAPIGDVGPLLVSALKPGEQTLTALRFEGGEVFTVTGSSVSSDDVLQAARKARVAVAGEQPESTPEKPKAVATVKRPTPSCPQCYEGAIGPATDVLLDFMTPEQHEQWRDTRSLVAIGSFTGHRYLLAHRHTKQAAVFGRICFDIDDQRVVHFHDHTVPPEEEVLSSKLILEHHEDWLRNEATLLGRPVSSGGALRRTAPLKNPFGDVGDGIADADFTRRIGEAVLGPLGLPVSTKPS